jgi:hypothetical protein
MFISGPKRVNQNVGGRSLRFDRRQGGRHGVVPDDISRLESAKILMKIAQGARVARWRISYAGDVANRSELLCG